MFIETALSRVEQKSLQEVFAVNTFAPILMSKVSLSCADACCVAAVHLVTLV